MVEDMWIGFQALSVSVVVLMNFLVFSICNAIYIPSERISWPDLDIFLQIRLRKCPFDNLGRRCCLLGNKKNQLPCHVFSKAFHSAGLTNYNFFLKFSITK